MELTITKTFLEGLIKEAQTSSFLSLIASVQDEINDAQTEHAELLEKVKKIKEVVNTPNSNFNHCNDIRKILDGKE